MVRKRDGRLQAFDLNKIELTLERISDESNRPLTGADLNILIRAIEKEFKNLRKDIIESKEIYGIVLQKLRQLGFKKIAKIYREFSRG